MSGSNLHSISVLYTEYAVPIAFCLALLYSSYELVVYCLCEICPSLLVAQSIENEPNYIVV